MPLAVGSPATREVAVLHRDDQLVVVQKPAGVVVHASDRARERDVVMRRVRDQLGCWVWPVHRLDRGTSGALLFALDAATARWCAEAFAEARIAKRYLAIVRGTPPREIHVDYPIPKDEGRERVDARTSLATLHSGEVASVVVAAPHTGRFHQIRRHLAHLRHPIANDTNYGTGWFNRHVRSEAALHRLALHAVSLTLPPRVEGQLPLRVVAPVPEDLAHAFATLGLVPDGLDALVRRATDWPVDAGATP